MSDEFGSIESLKAERIALEFLGSPEQESYSRQRLPNDKGSILSSLAEGVELLNNKEFNENFAKELLSADGSEKG